MEDEPILFPLVVPQSSKIIEESCAASNPTVLTTWRSPNNLDASYSVAIGSEDGSTFIFLPKQQNISSPATSNVDNNTSVRSTRPTSPRPSSSGHATVLHGPPSPSASHTGSFHFKSPVVSFQPSKSRVQAAISKELVEAPKNYVDFDDEPKKLKSLLKTREPSKDRGLLDNLIPSLHLHHRQGSGSDGAPHHLGRQLSYSQMSTNNPSSSSTSPPTSPVKESGLDNRGNPSTSPMGELLLVAHAIPPRFGAGRATTALKFMEDGAILISLQECGTLCMYSSADGYCLCSIEVASNTISQPPAAMPSIEENLKGVWRWQKMEIGTSGENTFLIIAAPDVTTSWDIPVARTRVVVVKVKTATERAFSAASEYLSKIGDVVKIYAKGESGLVLLQEVPVVNCQCLHFTQPDILLIVAEDEDHLYSLSMDGGELRCRLISVAPSDTRKKAYAIDGKHLISTYLTSRNIRKLQASSFRSPEIKRYTLWKGAPGNEEPHVPKITSILPVDFSVFILGYDDGYIRRASFSEIFSPQDGSSTIGEPSDQPVDGAVVHLSLIRNEHTGEYCLVGGTDGGGVAVWALKSLKLLARWALFATPLFSVTRLMDEAVGKLKGNVLCVASGGTLAILVMDSLEIAFIVPGGPSRLEKICLGEDNLLLIYANDLARLWDVKTQEFWRSMTRGKAEELLEQGGWFESLIEPGGPIFSSSALGCTERSFSSKDSASSLVLNLRNLIFSSDASLASNTTSTTTPRSNELGVFGNLAACCHTFDMEENIDTMVRDAFEILPIMAFGGICGYGGATSLVNASAASVWTISKDYTALRLLSICSILRFSMNVDNLEQKMNNIFLYYTASLPETVGKRFCAPSLEILAKYWFDPIAEIRTSARSLFDAAIGQLSDTRVAQVVEEYRHRLPCLQPDINKEADWAVLALIITGNLAIARHAVISPSTITDIVTSIVTFLHDQSSAHRVIGIDLSSRGLHIWQTYTDTMEILHSLFELAVSPRKDPDRPTIRDPGTQARLAVLHVASSSTHLFMTKLLLDLTHPKSSEHSRAILQLLAFLIRKRPLILYPSVSRWMEAVVRFMDPNSAFRETVLGAATEIIGEVVRLYPTVDFHSASQKLVVGTHEGAAILYDMKTSTRLYVLEGHKKRLAACSFSPDGRRLVTLSLEESVVMVWKVGTSFTSFFFPGAPPSQ
ncbi:hypothetical protein FRC17_001701, partial [Serendipita sp. 399]